MRWGWREFEVHDLIHIVSVHFDSLEFSLEFVHHTMLVIQKQRRGGRAELTPEEKKCEFIKKTDNGTDSNALL